MTDYEEIQELESRQICSGCVKETFLSKEIAKKEPRNCFYCHAKAPTISLKDFAGYIQSALENHFQFVSDYPDGFDYYLQKEGLWDKPGQELCFLLQEIAEIDVKPSDDIIKILDFANYDMEMAQIGEENPYAPDAHYEEKNIDDIDYREAWESFEGDIKSRSRFFSKSANQILSELFENLDKIKPANRHPILIDAGPGKKINKIYRARIFQSETDLEEALKCPEIHLGPPPFRLARAGRMNPHGISVFYGATSPQIAFVEIRPPVGSKVLTGIFNIKKPLKLLDFEALKNLPFVQGSLFDDVYLKTLQKHKFLERLRHRISQPVMPDDEPFDYLSTQAIAEFLSELENPKIDGVLFKSSQTKHEGSNIVLFHKSAAVKRMEIVPGSEISVMRLGGYEDEHYAEDESYTVFEELPEPKPKEKDDEKDQGGLLGLAFEDFSFHPQYETHMEWDWREKTLELDIKSLSVDRALSVSYRKEHIKVKRYKKTNGEDLF